MVFEFLNYKIDVDVERTKVYYSEAKLVSEECLCSGCRNYEKAVEHLPQKVAFFFAQLGIDIRKPTEVYVCCANPDNKLLYGGFYHVCGTIIHGESAWVSIGEGSKVLDRNKAFLIADDFQVFFHKECVLLDDNFPLPAIQLEIVANIPWVLVEKNEYC